MNSEGKPEPVKLPAATFATVDLLRGLLAVLVLIAHAVETTRHGFGLPVAGTGCGWMPTLAMQGAFWVGGFFVLSGFCVHLSVQKLMRTGRPWVGHYAWARLTRVYPLFFVALFLMTLAWWLIGPHPMNKADHAAARLAGHFVMLQGITGVFHELKPAWSLTYEMVYYAAWPLLICACGGDARKALRRGAMLALGLAAVLVVIWKQLHGGAGDSWLIPLWLIPAQFLLWLGGALLAVEWHRVAARLPRWAGAAAVFGLLAAWAAQGLLVQHGARQWMLLLCGYAALPCWLALIAASARWSAAADWPWLVRRMALLSYPLYLLHQLCLDGLGQGFGGWREAAGVWGFGGALGLGTLAAVWLAGIPLEAALLRWRAQSLRRQIDAAAPRRLAASPAA